MGILDEFNKTLGSFNQTLTGAGQAADTLRKQTGIDLGTGSSQSSEDALDAQYETQEAMSKAQKEQINRGNADYFPPPAQDRGPRWRRRRDRDHADDSFGGSFDGHLDNAELKEGWGTLSPRERRSLVEGLEKLTGQRIERDGRVDARALQNAMNAYVEQEGINPQGLEQGNGSAWRRLVRGVERQARDIRADNPDMQVASNRVDAAPVAPAPTTTAPSTITPTTAPMAPTPMETLPEASADLQKRINALLQAKAATMTPDQQKASANEITGALKGAGYNITPPRWTDEVAAYIQAKHPELAKKIMEDTDPNRAGAALDFALKGLKQEAAAKSTQTPSASTTAQNPTAGVIDREVIKRYLTATPQEAAAYAGVTAATRTQITSDQLREALQSGENRDRNYISKIKDAIGLKDDNTDQIDKAFLTKATVLFNKYGNDDLLKKIQEKGVISKDDLKDVKKQREEFLEAGKDLGDPASNKAKAYAPNDPNVKPYPMMHGFDYSGGNRTPATERRDAFSVDSSINNAQRMINDIRNTYARNPNDPRLQSEQVKNFMKDFEARTGISVVGGVTPLAAAKDQAASKDTPATTSEMKPMQNNAAKDFAKTMTDLQQFEQYKLPTAEVAKHLNALGIKTDPKDPKSVMEGFSQWATKEQSGVSQKIIANPTDITTLKDVPRLLDILEGEAKAAKAAPAKGKEETKPVVKEETKIPTKTEAKTEKPAPVSLLPEEQKLVKDLNDKYQPLIPMIPEADKQKLLGRVEPSLKALGMPAKDEKDMMEKFLTWSVKNKPEEAKTLLFANPLTDQDTLKSTMKSLVDAMAAQAQAKSVTNEKVKTTPQSATTTPSAPTPVPNGKPAAEAALW